ncbi:VOC family protein [Planococcus sp. YIM B11945]|uniref:VOC family protein n=1 Tax=Planococcus sp. YIM B11945 TaxID=3435410 RepID=UPI003D7C6550
MPKITTFLMFEGQAEEAMKLYTAVFEDSKVVNLVRNEDGSMMQAVVYLNGQPFMFSNSSVKHEFTFTPSISLFVTCHSEAEIDAVYDRLLEGGHALMPLSNYGFSQKFGWLNDRFGVSWQLNLPE